MIKDSLKLFYRLLKPVFDPFRLIKVLPSYISFIKDLRMFKYLDQGSSLKLGDIFPCLFNKGNKTIIDPHYFYQNIWAFKLIIESKVSEHVDVGSKADFVGMLSAVTRVTFIDIRPLEVDIDNFNSKAGSILSLPYPDKSVNSLSCLHVVEHIGLGRYGDPIDPEGPKKAAKELMRVLAPGGNLYFSLPIGIPKLCFNAHRIYSPFEILDMFKRLKLKEFSSISDDGKFVRFSNIESFCQARYSCGLFLFKAPVQE